MIGKGSHVSVPGSDSPGTVLEVRNGFAMVSMDTKASWQPLDILTDISDRLLSRLLEGDTDSPLKFILTVDANRLMTKYRFDPYVLASSTKIEIYPHQIHEVMWGIDNQRMMIADEVGLGKTIIAALIASERKARGLADRVLYVVPKSLVLKWQDELLTKFDTKVELLDADYVRFNSNPFSTPKYDYVTSMDFLKSENRKKLLRKLDLVIVDEAHKFKPGNERYTLGEELAVKSDSMIFLTATPHDGKIENFLGRMRLLDPFVTDVDSASHLWKRHVKEAVVTMEGKEVFPERKSETVDTSLRNSERAVHELLEEYIREKYEEVRHPQDLGAARFLATILRKRATSSLHSLRGTLDRRRDKIGKVKVQGRADPDDMENDDDYEDRVSEYEYFYAGVDIEREKARISGIISAIDGLGDTDSKFETLQGHMEKIKSSDPKAKILLFTEYRDTLDYLDERLSKRYSTGRIDGTMDMESRKGALEEFKKEGGAEILLCTDAAGEGVDMQFCNVEFNYDIPWNPNRLEQRMGRIHRIGQWRKVFYYNFVVDKDNTIDGMIHSMLLDKINSIKDAMGKDSVFDILGTIISEDMISRTYEELQRLPHEVWEAKIKAKLEDIEKTKENIIQKTDWLLTGHNLDRTMLEDIREIKMRAVDSGDVRRFLETWVESNGGRFEERGSAARIVAPRRIASRIGGILSGTLDGDIARKRGLEYIALGNKKVQAILADAIGNGSVTTLGHAKKSGILCAYNRSVIDGNGHRRNSETAMIFCNEDGAAEMVDATSIWDYVEAEARDAGAPVNANLLARMKDLADKKMGEKSAGFHDEVAAKLDRLRRRAREAIDESVAAEIEVQTAKISEWESRKDTNPHYARLIKNAGNECQKKKAEGDRRKAELDGIFKSHLLIELVGIARVLPGADANARTMSDRAGMRIVMERERMQAKTEKERNQVKDVSGRDCGYDIETAHRSIEVKSFEGHASPRMTSHEWATAGKFGDRYWLYVVENVHGTGDVTEIQDPRKDMAGLVTVETSTVDTYRLDWAGWKRARASKAG